MAPTSISRTFLSPKFVTRRIGDRDVKFYSSSAASLFAMKDIVEPLAKGVATLFADSTNDVERINQTRKDNEDGSFFTHDESRALSPELAKLRNDQRANAIRSIVEGIAENSTKIALAKVLMSSMRGEGFDKSPDDHAALSFWDDCDTESLSEMISALIEINKQLFAPFLARLPAKVKDALRGVDNSKSATPEAEPEPTSAPASTG